MKIFLIGIVLLLLTACESKARGNINSMMEMIDDPLDGMTVSKSMRKSMGVEGVIIEYKKCMTKMPENMFLGLKESVAEDAEIKSITKVSECPTPYDALCESKTGKQYFYTDVKRILDGQKEACDYMKHTWTANTQGKEIKAKMYKATFHVNGTPYSFESTNNCAVNPINKDIIFTPQMGDGDVWVKLSANIKKDEQGCMFDFSLNDKHYHAEKCDVNYDGKKLTGKTTAKDIQKHTGSAEIIFDIVCE